MQIKYTVKAKKDLDFWIESKNKKILSKIISLIENIVETPYSGLGKPESLKHELSGKWSRRIDKEHRIIYQINENVIYVYSLKGHY